MKESRLVLKRKKISLRAPNVSVLSTLVAQSALVKALGTMDYPVLLKVVFGVI